MYYISVYIGGNDVICLLRVTGFFRRQGVRGEAVLGPLVSNNMTDFFRRNR